ncbi:ribulokinase [Parabacteroides pacaensis]|uniref:ribulokinase n=1 Tax=Parabacteroides pacaensis TaxID=2086575 RepID=UPI000D0F7B1A|nr:ribulokinase [Parabacteroides pacaensis]
MNTAKLVIGLDYGTDSCRAVIVNALTGEEQASAVAFYPRWKAGKYCNPAQNQYRQHPLDYIETMEEAIKKALSQCPPNTGKQITGLSFDTTGSTPVLLNAEGTPLALLPRHAENPNAMFVLWKDHTAIREANEINELAKQWHVDYTSYSGGIYSSEWAWAKMTHMLRVDESLREDAYSWTEHCDWMPALLTGKTKPETMLRSRCAAGHKAMWNESWGGLPSSDFLTTLEPLLHLFTGHLYTETYTSDTAVGTLTPEWAEKLGLTTKVKVGVGALDCHMGAIGAQISAGSFVRVIGTSTCDIMVSSYQEMDGRLIEGICGQVDGSVLPGMIGLEAGQSAFGDIYAWYKNLLAWPIEKLLPETTLLDASAKAALIEEMKDAILPMLTREAEKIPATESSPVAVDWLNGRRTPYANQSVKGTISGLTLGTSAPLLFRALVEATAYGSKAIVDSILAQGIKIENVIGIGGISLKSPFVMKTLSNVLGMPIKVAAAEQACALGAAMFAAVVAGICQTTEEAQQKMGKGFVTEYHPDPEAHAVYLQLYDKYSRLGKFTETSL